MSWHSLLPAPFPPTIRETREGCVILNNASLYSRYNTSLIALKILWSAALDTYWNTPPGWGQWWINRRGFDRQGHWEHLIRQQVLAVDSRCLPLYLTTKGNDTDTVIKHPYDGPIKITSEGLVHVVCGRLKQTLLHVPFNATLV